MSLDIIRAIIIYISIYLYLYIYIGLVVAERGRNGHFKNK